MPKADQLRSYARRAFVAVWIALGIAGALNHTIAIALFGRRFELVLPHLRYGHVMFNLNPRTVSVYEYARADGVRRPLAELVATPALGYRRARLAINVMSRPDYLAEVCYRATRARDEAFTFFIDTYEVDLGARRLSASTALHCDAHGLAAH